MPFIDPSCKLWCILRDDVGIAPPQELRKNPKPSDNACAQY